MTNFVAVPAFHCLDVKLLDLLEAERRILKELYAPLILIEKRISNTMCQRYRDVLAHLLYSTLTPGFLKKEFKDIVTKVIPLDAPGVASLDLDTFPYRNIPRPVFPLDEDVKFEQMKVFL